MAGSFFNVTVADNTVKSNGEPETSSYSVPITQLSDSGANTAELILVGNLQTAIAAVLLGTYTKKDIIFNRDIFTPGPASSLLAQRENKFLCRYHNPTSGNKFRISLPTADLTKLTAHSEFINLASGPGAAIKTAWELVVVDPDDGTTLTILDSMQFVGRNS